MNCFNINMLALKTKCKKKPSFDMQYPHIFKSVIKLSHVFNSGLISTLQPQNLKLIQKMSSDIEYEQGRVKDDQNDNQMLQKFVQKYREMQKTLSESEIQKEEYRKQIQLLKGQLDTYQQQNQQLLIQLKTLKQGKKSETQQNNLNTNSLTKTSVGQSYPSNFVKTPPGMNRTLDQSNFTQQTKRRVINNFVGELTQELEQSQLLLRKERKMQEEARRSLMLCNEESATLKIAVKDLENRVISLNLENQKLYCQLQSSESHVRQLQQQLQIKTIKSKQTQNSLMVNLEQFQAEMDKMDAIYGNIELELTTIL